MTSIYRGKVILKLFAKKYAQESWLFVESNLFVDKQTLISIYNAIVRPYFDYCCEVWDVFGETQSKRLQKLQNRAVRIVLDASNDVNHTIALRTLGWEPLSMERKKADV